MKIGNAGDPVGVSDGEPGTQQRGDVVVPPGGVRVAGSSWGAGKGHIDGEVVAGGLEPVLGIAAQVDHKRRRLLKTMRLRAD